MGTQLAEVDRAIEVQLALLQLADGDPAKGKQRGRRRKAPKFDLRTMLFRVCGVDLTRIDGIDVTAAAPKLARLIHTMLAKGADPHRTTKAHSWPRIRRPENVCG